MPFHSQWLVEGRVTISRFWGSVTLDDLRGANARKIAFLEASSYPHVHILVDMSAVDYVPVNYALIRDALTMFQHPKLDRAVLYGNLSTFIKLIAGIVMRLMKVQLRVLSSYAEAAAYLLEHDPDLAGLLPETLGDGPPEG